MKTKIERAGGRKRDRNWVIRKRKNVCRKKKEDKVIKREKRKHIRKEERVNSACCWETRVNNIKNKTEK